MATWTQAFVSGVSKYKLQPLKCPANDVKDMSRELRDKAHCRVQTCLDATKVEFNACLSDFCSRLPQGAGVIFHFSGHGATEHSTQQHYLMCKDSDAAELTLTQSGVSVDDILGRIAAAVGPKGSIVAILDTCRSVTGGSTDNEFTASGYTEQPSCRQIPNTVNPHKLLELLAAKPEVLELQLQLQSLGVRSSSNKSQTAGAAEPSKRQTPVLLCHACEHGQTASEGGSLARRNGWYTSCILKHMFRPSYDSLLEALSTANMEYCDRFPDRQSPMALPGQGYAIPFMKPFIIPPRGSGTSQHPVAAPPSNATGQTPATSITHQGPGTAAPVAACASKLTNMAGALVTQSLPGSVNTAATQPPNGTLPMPYSVSKPTNLASINGAALAGPSSKPPTGPSVAACSHPPSSNLCQTASNASSTMSPRQPQPPAEPTWRVTSVLGCSGSTNLGPNQQRPTKQLALAGGLAAAALADGNNLPSISNGSTQQATANCPATPGAPVLSLEALRNMTVAELKAWATEYHSDGADFDSLARSSKSRKADWVDFINSKQQRRQ